MIIGVDHVALSVSDLERSIKFYKKNFGFEVRRRIEADSKFPLGKVIGIEGAKADIAHLYLHDFMLELFYYYSPSGKPILKEQTQADNGYIHFGLRVNNIFEEINKLKSAEVEFVGEVVEVRPDVWVVYFYGPDREICELKQI